MGVYKQAKHDHGLIKEKETDQKIGAMPGMEKIPGQLRRTLTALGASIEPGDDAVQRQFGSYMYKLKLDVPMTRDDCDAMVGKIDAALKSLTQPENTDYEYRTNMALLNMDDGHKSTTFTTGWIFKTIHEAPSVSAPSRGKELSITIAEVPRNPDHPHRGLPNPERMIQVVGELADYEWSRLAQTSKDGSSAGRGPRH